MPDPESGILDPGSWVRNLASPAPDPDNPHNPDNPADPVHRLQLGTSPTRAGGQDDVSFSQTPSNHNTLKSSKTDLMSWVDS